MELSQAYDGFLADLAATFSLGVVALVGLAMVVIDSFKNDARSIPWLGGLALAVCMVWEGLSLTAEPGTAFLGFLRTGGYAAFINLVLLGSALFTIILSSSYLDRIQHAYGEVYALLMFATVGMIVLATANNLIAIFIGLETMSICLYVMTGLIREDRGATESALKYFLLGAFSTGFFLYGIALLYGATGTMYLPEMSQAEIGGQLSVMFWAGVALLLVGFMFKVSAAPFHMWTPDVYQGAPTTLTGFMSTASKAAAFSSLILVLYFALPAEQWSLALAVIAVITMVLGNVLALSQTNVKRLLAYSSIAHAGYVLVGLAAGTPAGYSGALYYLLVYTLMNIGAFGVMAFLEWDGTVGREQDLDSLAGVGRRRPLLGVTMGVFMFSLIGFPPLGGFFGKYAVFAPAIQAGLTWLALVGVLASAVSAYYYLRVLVVFYFMASEEAPETVQNASFPVPASSAAVLVTCAVLLFVLVLLGVPDLTGYFLSPAEAMARTP